MATPKYEKVERGIINLIATKNINNGKMLPTEKELAKCFDVSIITIRRAVEHLEENKIVRREQGRGTFVIADIQGRLDNGTIAFLSIARKSISYAGEYIPYAQQMNSEWSRRGYTLNVMIAARKPGIDAISGLKDTRGIIVSGCINAAWVEILNALDIPVVILGGILCDPMGISVVDYDWKRMAEMLARHLFEKGARNIGLILGGSDYAPSPLMKAGLVSVMKRRGARLDPALVYYSDNLKPGTASHSIGHFLASHPDVDGFLVERGCYVHVLHNLFNSSRRPLLGVMTAEPEFGSSGQQVYEAAFKDDISAKTMEVLLELIQSGKKSVKDVKLEPYLVLTT